MFALLSFFHDLLYATIGAHGLSNEATVVDSQNVLIHHLLNGLCTMSSGHECFTYVPSVNPEGLRLAIFQVVIIYSLNDNTPVVEIHALCRALGLDCLLENNPHLLLPVFFENC